MARFLECAFLIPLRRDPILSDGELHKTEAWRWLNDQLYVRFKGRTIAPGLYKGVYEDPDRHEPVPDQSRKYIVAIPTTAVDGLRELLSEACSTFRQKCIYLSAAGEVEFVQGADK